MPLTRPLRASNTPLKRPLCIFGNPREWLSFSKKVSPSCICPKKIVTLIEDRVNSQEILVSSPTTGNPN